MSDVARHHRWAGRPALLLDLSGLDDRTLRVGIKHLPGGLFSTCANTVPREGDTLLVLRPEGRFGVAIEPAASRVFAAFAAGSGITPVLSIIKTVLTRAPASRFFLFFGNRATRDIMFRDEIEDLKDRYLVRLSVFHVLSRERQELGILNGHLDPEKVPALARLMPRRCPAAIRRSPAGRECAAPAARGWSRGGWKWRRIARWSSGRRRPGMC